VRTIRRWCRDARPARLALSGPVLALFFLGSASAYAQSGAQPAPGPGPALRKGSVEVAGIIGTTLPVSWLRAHADRRLTLASLQMGRIMTNDRGHGPLAGSFEFLLEMTPLLVVRQPAPAFGLAVSPLHMRWNLAPNHRVRPFAEASGGIIYTNQAVPVRTTTFNFIDQAGFGLRVQAGRLSVLGGYRFQHISNAGRVEPNPGVNFNFLYAGVNFQR
jgi:lipid A 3-O-deacylase PagL